MKKTKKRLFTSSLAGVLALLMLLGLFGSMPPTPAAAASSSEIKEQINGLKEEQDKIKQDIKDLKADINDNMSEMERMVAEKGLIDQEIFLLNEQVGNINQQIQAYNLLIADKQDELDAARERFDALTQKNKERIRAMEMYGEMSYWSVLAQAGTFGELLDRLSMVSEIAAADNRRLKEMSDAAKLVEEAQTVLETEKAGLEETRALLDAAQQELLTKRAQADELLLELVAVGEEYEKLMEQAEEDAKKLLEEITEAEKAYNEAKRKEYLQWLSTSVPPTTTKRPSYGNGGSSTNDVAGITWHMPIAYYSRVSSPYGWRIHPVHGDRRFHSGVDLAAPQGTSILAAQGGVVIKAGYSSSNGYYVTIDHGNGFQTSYLHMTHYTVSKGQKVTAGQKIGACGSTGISTGPHLHFTVYKNGATVNPANYIRF